MNVMIFQVHEHLYAVDAATVREIIDPLPVTPLPFVSSAVVGLINVSGRVMTLVSTARRLELEEGPDPEQGSIMIFSIGHRATACQVSRVIAKVTIAADAVSSLEEDEHSDPETALIGEFYWNDAIVLLLDPARLVMEPACGDTDTDRESFGLVSEAAGDDLRHQEQLRVDDFPCVVFSCNNELFAFRFDDVSEVVESGTLTPLPGAPAELTGVVLLRDTPLPVISMRALLFGVAGETLPLTVVVRLNGCNVGLQVERILGIQRFACNALKSLEESHTLLEGFVTTRDDRLVSLIRFSALTAPERFDTWRAWLINSHDEAAESAGYKLRTAIKKRLLLFWMGKELMALPLDMIERVEEYSAPTITPEDESGTMNGVIQVQGRIVPVHSIAFRMGGVSDRPPCAFLIVASAGNRCAVAVDRIERVFDMDESRIESACDGHNELLCGIGRYNDMLVSLLDAERLAA